MAITNDGDTLVDVLMDIAYADEDDPRACPESDRRARPEQEPALSLSKGRRITAYHRNQAGRMLIDRGAGTNPALAISVAQTDSSAHPEHSQNVEADDEDRPSDDEIWAKIDADLKQMEDAGILHRDPNAPPIDISMYRMPKDFDSTPYEEEEAASFWAEIDLRIERQK